MGLALLKVSRSALVAGSSPLRTEAAETVWLDARRIVTVRPHVIHAKCARLQMDGGEGSLQIHEPAAAFVERWQKVLQDDPPAEAPKDPPAEAPDTNDPPDTQNGNGGN